MSWCMYTPRENSITYALIMKPYGVNNESVQSEIVNLNQ